MSDAAETIVMINGFPMRLDRREAIQDHMAGGLYEPEQSEWVRRCLAPGAVFVDVGANFGWFTTLALSLVGPAGRVFAFEPSPVAFATLKRTIDDAGCGNAVLTNAAVGRAAGAITIYLPQSGPVHSPSAFESPGDFVAFEAPLVCLDEVEALAAMERIDLVKIDVEGSEPDVLAGMTSLIRAGRVRRVMCEFNSWWLAANHTGVADLQQRFLDLGFSVEDRTTLQQGPASGGGIFECQDILYRYGEA